MRLQYISIRSVCVSVAAVATMCGCAPEQTNPNDGLIGLVAGITETGPSSAPPTQQSSDGATVASGRVSSRGDFELVELGSGAAGQELTLSDETALLAGGSFLVVLFNSDYDLLYRQVVSAGRPLQHTLRHDTGSLYLGVTPAYGSGGGDFRFGIDRRNNVGVPLPQRQVVWLDFDGASDAVVNSRAGIDFPPFDAATLGSSYAGATEVIKAAIIAAMEEDYASYDVVIATSDDGPPPSGPYATIYFGGSDSRLLGLADNVDQYNSDPWQSAIIYVEGFADFEVMGLSDEEMGQMVGNVASHEFGHLLGLFHTQVPEDLMDTTGTAWDLARDQSFMRGELEESVFPMGYENSPERLAEIVGRKANAAKTALARPLGTAKMARKATLRALVREELRCRCGNCLDPD